MAGIDSVAAALLASRIDSLLNAPVLPSAGGAAAAQVGTQAARASGAVPPPAGARAPLPPASAQTALSDVARVLDAISRVGGDATPAVVGRVPLVADPALLSAAEVSPGAGPGAPVSAQQAAQAARPAQMPQTAALAAALSDALAQAVTGSGLFYESHLAQWLAGQWPAAALAREPQARVPVPVPVPVPDARAAATDAPGDADALDVLLAAREPLPSSGPARGAPPPAPAPRANPSPDAAPAGDPHPLHAFLTSGPAAPPRLVAIAGDPRDAAPPAHAQPAAADAAPPAAPLPPEIATLVRQQLDVLATDQFRWVGDAWPGARLDWTIEPDESGAQTARGRDADDGIAWRTRLTLTLPSLGTVDAELVLNGARVVARVRASQAGAARLTRHEAALRQRLHASGLELGGLSIRAVDGAQPAFDAVATRAATTAYARAADAAGAPFAAARGADADEVSG